jgi:two-component system response regulator YesN
MYLNVLIVDDESHIRNGMKMKVDWESLEMRVTAEASDGAEALEYIKNDKIDLVITDINMPIMDGLRLIQKALEINKDLKFIVISGYSEFKYAHKAMKFGISEYLLKPLKEADMQTSLLKIREEILATESVWLKERAQREHSKRREESLLQWLTDKHTQIATTELEQELKLELDTDNILLGVMKTELHGSLTGSIERVRNPTLYADIESAFNAFLTRLGGGYIIKSIRPEHEFILLLHPQSAYAKEQIVHKLNSFIGELGRQLDILLTVGLGGTHMRPQSIKTSYTEALFAIKERILCGSGIVIEYAKISLKGDKPNFGVETKLLIHYLKEKKWDNIKAHIDHMFHHFNQKEMGFNHSHVFELFIEVYFVIKQFSQGESSLHQESPVMDGADIMEVVNDFSSTDQIAAWLYKYTEMSCHHLKDGQDTSGKEIVFRVKNYIKEFYSSDITLNRISEKHHIHPIYFSRIFKKYVGESFHSYITRIRMEEAKKLMETTSLKMLEISEIVGYEDPKYFSKVFKKHFGVSPSMYTEHI